MIKFFRKIRQNLLSEGKTGKYLKYAFGEIILVVIGILIALGINNWNENRINSNKQLDYINGLKVDLENQITSLTKLDHNYDGIINKGESILVDFSSTGSLLEIDSLNKKMSFLMYAGKYPEITTTFNELNSTGQLNLIKNISLRSHVIKYYQNSNHFKNSIDGNENKIFYDQIFPVIKSTVILNPENFNIENKKINLLDNLKAAQNNILDNPIKEFELVNVISMKIILSKHNKGNIEKAKKEAVVLLDSLNNELDKN